MAKKKNIQSKKQPKTGQANRQTRLPRPTQPIPAGAVPLARYHAALSDPFTAAPTGIPDGAPAVTLKGKMYSETGVLTSSGVEVKNLSLRVKLTRSSPTDTTIRFETSDNQGGSWSLVGNQLLLSSEMRVVAAAVRIIYAGRRDALGGVYATFNEAADANQFEPLRYQKFNGVATALWEPYRLSDFEFHAGYGASTHDTEDKTRTCGLQLSSAGDLAGSMIEFVAIYESESPPVSPSPQYIGVNRHSYHASSNHSSGPHHVKNVASRMTKTPKLPSSGGSHHSKLTHYKNNLVSGLKHATEVMGAGVGSVVAYKQLSAAMSLGAEIESDVAMAAEALGGMSPMLLAL